MAFKLLMLLRCNTLVQRYCIVHVSKVVREVHPTRVVTDEGLENEQSATTIVVPTHLQLHVQAPPCQCRYRLIKLGRHLLSGCLERAQLSLLQGPAAAWQAAAAAAAPTLL